MGHPKSSSSKSHGGSHGKSHGSSSGSSSKRQYVDVMVWYCDHCTTNGPWNIQLDVFCPNCRHQRCHGCQTSVIRQRVGQ